MAVDSDVVRRAYLKVTGSKGLVGSTLVLYIYNIERYFCYIVQIFIEFAIVIVSTVCIMCILYIYIYIYI